MKLSKFSKAGRRIAAFVVALLMFCTTAFADYDPNFDYGAALMDPDLSDEERAEYERARQEKIDDMYGGEEPPLWGGDGSTFSDHYSDLDGNGTNEFDWGDIEENFTGSGLTDEQWEVIQDMMEAADNGTISVTEALNAIDEIQEANENGIDIPTEGDATTTYLKMMGYDDNDNNHEQAVVAIMNNYGQIDTESGSEILREGGVVYIQDENGKWVPDSRYPMEEGAVILSDEDLEEILYAKDMWDNATTQEEKDYWHDYAEGIRDDNGYSGGHDGGFFNYDEFGTGGNGGGFIEFPEPVDESYSIYAYQSGEGSISPDGWSHYLAGAIADVYTITPAEGWKLHDVLIDSEPAMSRVTDLGNNRYSYSFGTVTSNHTIKAIFVEEGAQYFSIRAYTNEGGTISNPGYTEYKKGSSATYTITPDEGYYIHDVFVSEGFGTSKSIGATRSVEFNNIDRDYIIEVLFVAVDRPYEESFKITAEAGPNGSITNEGERFFTKGSNISYTVTANTGYKIEVLKVDGSPVPDATHKGNYTYTFNNLASSHTISVTFRDSGTIDDITGITVGPNGRTESTKSGYGIGCEVKPETTNARVTSVTCVNSATGHTFTMVYDATYDKWVMPENNASKVKARVDYLPVDLPDGEYKFTITVKAVDKYDGTEVPEKTIEVTYTVDGSMYEDDFTGDRR